jgi:hypothetical protein
VLHGALEWSPGGHADLGLLGGLSVIAAAEAALFVESASGNASYATDLYSVLLGLRYRLRVDDVELRADGGYRALVFTVHPGAAGDRPDLPNLEIHAARAGAALRWDIGLGLFFTSQLAYLAPISLGEIQSDAWFPRAIAGGIEGDLGMGLRIDDVELRGLFAFRRFFYDMGSVPGDARVAGGAVDQYLSGVLEATWTPRL